MEQLCLVRAQPFGRCVENPIRDPQADVLARNDLVFRELRRHREPTLALVLQALRGVEIGELGGALIDGAHHGEMLTVQLINHRLHERHARKGRVGPMILVLHKAAPIVNERLVRRDPAPPYAFDAVDDGLVMRTGDRD